MTTMQRQSARGYGRMGLVTSALLTAITVGSVQQANAQEAIGVPFIGRNHLSFYTTDFSRDGIGDERASVYGGLYGRRLGDRDGAGELSLLVRAAARAFDDPDAGILDSGITLAGTHTIGALDRLSVTAAAGLGAVMWGQDPVSQGAPDTGRMSVRVPLAAGLAYEIRAGAATLAPFAALTTTYSSERDYVADERVATDGGWRIGNSMGLSVRFNETVLSISSVNRERGRSNGHRIVFGAGMSW